MSTRSAMRAKRTPGDGATRRPARLVALLVGATVVAFFIYAPALDGELISDDLFYVGRNPAIRSLDAAQLAEILDPSGPAAVLTLNYAPVHLIAHALEWQAFGSKVRGYHVVNVLLHVGVSALCAGFLLSLGLGRRAAALGAAIFLVHPANVEAVAWIFQLKTILSTGLGLASLLLWRRWPWLAVALFAAALLCKISAAFVLPAALVAWWCTPGDRADAAREGRTLLALAVVFVVVSVPVWTAIQRTALGVDVPATEVALQVRTFFALAARYAVMALTSYGVSAFQQPAPPGSWADPWAAVGLLLVMAVAARWGVGVRARRNEAVAWTLVGAAYLPVSQIVPFPFPFADHYLYPMLPGVIGAVALLLSGALDRVGKDVGPGRALAARLDATPTQLITALALIALCGVFAARAHARAGLFRSAQTLSEDAARHYPDGREASLLAAWQAAREGDAATAARSLRRAADQGYRSFGAILSNPAYAGVRDDPAVRAVIEDMAAFWIARAEQVESPTQLQLRTFSNAHYVRGELEQSIHLLERALALGGPADEEIAADLDSRRLELRLSERLGRPYGGLR